MNPFEYKAPKNEKNALPVKSVAVSDGNQARSEAAPASDRNQDFSARTKNFFETLHREKCDFVAEHCPEIPQKEIRKYLTHLSPELQALVKEWEESGLSIQMIGYMMAPSDSVEGEMPSTTEYQLIGLDENVAFNEELDKEYGNAASPLIEDFGMERIIDLRAHYLLALEEGSETSASSGEKFLSFLYNQYLLNEVSVPSKLKLLIPSQKRAELDRSYSETMTSLDDQTGESEQKIETLKGEERARRKSELADQGTHETIAKRVLATEEAGRESGLSRMGKNLREQINLGVQQLDAIITKYPDPRVLLDKLLGLQNGQLPFTKKK